MTDHRKSWQLEWNGIAVTIEFDPDYSKAYRDVYGFALTHLVLRTQDRQPLPVTETGFRSAFLPAPCFDVYESVPAYVTARLDAESASPKWQRLYEERRQGSLF